MTTALVDPHLSAFLASDPSVLAPPAPVGPETQLVGVIQPVPDQRTPEIELAAAVLVVLGLVARRLAHRDPEPDPRAAAKSAWDTYAPLWLRLAVPAISHAYDLGDVTGVSDDELQAMATDYAAGLGGYLNDSSADALAAGIGEQLNAKWSERLAWQRAVAGYGLDRPAMHTHIAGLMRMGEGGTNTDVVPNAARYLVDQALLRRADQVGLTESWRAAQSGKVIAWLHMQRTGRLPADAAKQWKTREDETTCPICAPLDDVIVALDQPWVTVGGVRLWAPGAHPGCRCEPELVLPENWMPGVLGKAYDPREQRDKSTGRWAQTDTATTTVSVDSLIADAVRNSPPADTEPVNPFGVAQTADPFAQAATSDPFAPDPFAATSNPFAVAAAEAAVKGKAGGKPKARKRVVVNNRLLLMISRITPQETGFGSTEHPFYMPSDEFFDSFEDESNEYDYRFDPGEVVNFDEMMESKIWSGEIDEDHNDAFAVSASAPKERADMFEDNGWFEEPHGWAAQRPLMRSVWNDALANPEGIVQELSSRELSAIFEFVGANPNKHHSAQGMRERLVEEVHSTHDTSTGLAAAYADYVVFNRPGLTGSNGEALSQKLEEWREDWFVPTTPRQNFLFENGFHENSPFDDERRLVALHGPYVITAVDYHSNIGSFGGGKPGVMGWRSLYMAPMLDNPGVPDDDDEPLPGWSTFGGPVTDYR